MKEGDKTQIVCPECGCEDERVTLISKHKKIGLGVGSGIGLITCFLKRKETIKTYVKIGAKAGACIPVVGSAGGASTGFIVAISAVFTGAGIGSATGELLDKCLKKYKCGNCGHVFRMK